MADNDETESKQPHVVAVPVPAQGHLNPLMRFCEALALHHGFLVTFVNIDPVHERLEGIIGRQGEAEEEAGQTARQLHKPDAADLDLKKEISSAGKVCKAHIPGLDLASDSRHSLQLFFEALPSMRPHLERLIRSLNERGPPVTCIISDMITTLATQDVADKLNIPMIAFVTSSASRTLLSYHVTQGTNVSVSTVLEALSRGPESPREAFGDGLIGLPTIFNRDLPRYKHVTDENLFMWDFTVRYCRETFRRAYAIAFNTFEDLESSALMALSEHLSTLPVYGVGPLVEPLHKESSTSLWREDEACIPWLDQQPPLSVLYISFGSVSILSQAQIEEIVAGLIASQQRFLWVFRPDLAKNVENASALVSDITLRSHGRGYVVSWAPQLSVLAHPSVGGFLTHCGWNSVMEAIAHGIPMICWPYFADQFLNAKYVVDEWKVGLQFDGNVICAHSAEDDHGSTAPMVERGEVESVVRSLMQGEKGSALRINARRLRDAGRQSLQPGGSSHSNMQALVDQILFRPS